MKRMLYILIPLLIGLGLRLYPTLITGMPFSTDGWPIIRNTELLIENTPVPLNSQIFDGYNNFMPANSLFAAILSQVTNIPPIQILALGMPLVGALSIPVFYVLAFKITKVSSVSLIASILLATAFPLTMFGAGVTKETFATPIYLSLILIFLLKHDWKTTLLFSIVSLALVLSHQLTTFLTLGIMGVLAIAMYFSRDTNTHINSNKSNVIFITILSIIAGIYYGFYATPALTITIEPSSVLAVGAYMVLTVTGVLYFVYKPMKPSLMRTLLKYTLSILIPVMLLFISTQVALLPGNPTLPFSFFLFALPFLIEAPLIMYGIHDLRKGNTSPIIPVFWLASVLGLACFVIFDNPLGGAGLVYRFLDFILPPFVLLAAMALSKIYSIKPCSFAPKTTAKISAIMLILIIACTSVYTLCAAVSLQEPDLGYFWRYEPTEYVASEWIMLHGNNQTLTADVKTQYLLHGYFGVNVDVLSGLNYLDGNGTEPKIIYIYKEMETDGYVLYAGTSVALPVNWTSKLADYNIIYVNSGVTIYAER